MMQVFIPGAMYAHGDNRWRCVDYRDGGGIPLVRLAEVGNVEDYDTDWAMVTDLVPMTLDMTDPATAAIVGAERAERMEGAIKRVVEWCGVDIPAVLEAALGGDE